ncbi:unnamed protein product [Phyllotreta striolata]|uniref:NADH dehydrogenase [ubiquinone] 1 beta subcomplex subunit 11, mitochondrial n=1 Tax=Phyllotreta striolata TaxID=444603 RepID=A0A9N9TU17_PHYSR|nr:unnamed protein product [Phyllotreta striolata]
MITKSLLDNSRKLIPILARRYVSTSKGHGEKATGAVQSKPEEKNWMSYGFDHYNKDDDRRAMHSVTFASITLCLVLGGFYFAYMPDVNLNDWAQREAYLELHRREAQGISPINPNYIDPKRINLPSDSELEGVEIII